jgi:hypothetical protein
MRLIQNINQRPVARITMILLAAVMLSAAVTDALAAGRGGVGEGSHGGGGGIKGSHIEGAFRGPLLSRPFNATAGLQSVKSIHGASIARDSCLASKSGLGVREWLKRSQQVRSVAP